MDFIRHYISHLLGAPGRNRPHFGALLLRSCLVFGLFLTLNVQSAFSQDGNPPSPAGPMPAWNVQTLDGPPYFVNMTSRALSFQTGDQPCAAYGGDGLYYTCYITPTWQTRTVIDNSVGVGQYASLSQRYIPYLGGRLRSAITYYDAVNGRLKLAYKDVCSVCFGGWSYFEVPTPIPP
jgi:hypothetical protein